MRKQKQGFTLIELMVVVVIIGLMTGAALLTFPSVENKLLKEQANRITRLISLAQDEAILQSTEMALEITPSGYEFYHIIDNQWQAYTEKPFTVKALPTELRSKFLLDGLVVDLKDRKKGNPQIVILSSGEMTPFAYILQFKDQSLIKLEINANGEVVQIFVDKDAS